jgi:hypothetical protein
LHHIHDLAWLPIVHRWCPPSTYIICERPSTSSKVSGSKKHFLTP